jgi:RNA recognition motif-containing protein
MNTPEAAQEALGKLNNSEFEGRRLIVNEAKPRAEKSGEGRFGGGDRPFRKY